MPHRVRILLTLLALAPPLLAQVYPFRTYTVGNGLVSDVITCITQDSRGYLWIGTSEGFSIFDGDAFGNFTVADGLPNGYLNSILESRRHPGTMWMGSNGGGIYRWESGRLTVLRPEGSDLQRRVNALAEDSSGNIWCGTDDGLLVVAGGQVSPVLRESIRGYVPSLLWLGDSLLVVACERGVVWYEHATGKVHELRLRLKGGELPGPLIALEDQSLWLGGTGGEICVIRGRVVVHRIDLGEAGPSAFVPGRNGSIWVTTGRGVLRFRSGGETARPTLLTSANGLPEDLLTCGFSDREGNLWFGGKSHGLAMLSTMSIVRFPIAEVGSMANDGGGVVDRRGHLWTITSHGLTEIWRSGDGGWVSREQPLANLASVGAPSAVLYDQTRDLLWLNRGRGNLESYGLLMTQSGDTRLRKMRSFRFGVDLPPHPLTRVRIDWRGRLYCCFQGLGIALLDPSRPHWLVRLFTPEEGVPDLDVRAVLADRRGHLWCGTYSGGLAELEGIDGNVRLVRRWREEEGLPDNSVRTIFEDRQGRLWIGTRYGGLAMIDRDSLQTFSVKNGLLSNAIWSIAQDRHGAIWIGSESGLQTMHPETFRLSSTPELEGKIVYSCGCGDEGSVWAFTPNGTTVLDLTRRRGSLPPPPVYITEVRVNGQRTLLDGDLDLSSSESNVSVDFVGISLSAPERVRYSYRLEPTEGGWLGPTAHHSLTFAALSPGRYRLLVKASNANGVESIRPASLGFQIATPIWARWWFLLLSGGGFLAVALAVVRARVRRSLEIERLRTRIATDLHDDIGASLTRITVFADAVRREIESGAGGTRMGRITALLADIGSVSRELVDNMSDVVWSVDPRNDSFESLLLRMKTTSARVLEAKGMEYEFDIPEGISALRLPLDFRRNFFLVFKEALTNSLRHSGARQVWIAVAREGEWLTLSVADDGRGFETEVLGQGNGLRNMRRRSGQLEGQILVESTPGQGTTVRLKAKLP